MFIEFTVCVFAMFVFYSFLFEQLESMECGLYWQPAVVVSDK